LRWERIGSSPVAALNVRALIPEVRVLKPARELLFTSLKDIRIQLSSKSSIKMNVKYMSHAKEENV
jgi:hypothetical protein